MSHSAWAKAQDCSRNAKAVLKSLGDYADVRGRSWVAMNVLCVETSMLERTVQRALSECRKLGLIKLTGQKELFAGKLYPIYELQLDIGPANTRERLRNDRNRAGLMEIGADLGVSPVSPQNPTGVTGDDPRGVSSDTQIEPKLSSLEAKASRSERTRDEDRSIFRSALAAYPKTGRGVTHVNAAWALWKAAGVPEAALLAAVLAYAADPSLKRRDFGAPSFQKWLSEHRFEAWLSDERSPSNAVCQRFDGDPNLRTAIVKQLGEPWAASYLDPCTWDGGARKLIAKSRVAYDAITKRASATLQTFQIAICYGETN